MTLALLWKSEPGELFTSGKYNEPAFARGIVFVGTDRIQAFGLGGRRAVRGVETPAPPREARAKSNDGPAARDGRSLYDQRCASCHDQPQGSVPPRELIAKRSRQHIVETLTRGAMRPFTEGLGADEIEAIAGYLH